MIYAYTTFNCLVLCPFLRKLSIFKSLFFTGESSLVTLLIDNYKALLNPVIGKVIIVLKIYHSCRSICGVQLPYRLRLDKKHLKV